MKFAAQKNPVPDNYGTGFLLIVLLAAAMLGSPDQESFNDIETMLSSLPSNPKSQRLNILIMA